MSFLYPTFLWALLTVSIPILIHLFSFKRHKTVYFSNVDLLKAVKKESKKKSKLKHLLMLTARILTIIFLVFTFVQPFIPANDKAPQKESTTVGIYIDNSFSMNALSEEGQLLEAARNKAVEIVQAYNQGTQFRLFTNDLENRHQYTLNKDQIIQEISNVTTSPQVIALSTIHNKMDNAITGNNKAITLYLLSDFQSNSTDLENFTQNGTSDYLIPLQPNKTNNLYIDSVWVEIPAHRLKQEELLHVKIVNSSNEDYQNLPLKLFINDSLKTITNFSVEAQKSIISQLKYINLSGGLQNGKIEISDYPFTYDNNWFISYYVKPTLNALAIYDNTASSKQGLQYLSALLDNDEYIKLDKMPVKNVQISRLNRYNTIFLTNLQEISSGLVNQLLKVAEQGASLVIFPELKRNSKANQSLFAKFNLPPIESIDTTTQEISGIEYRHPFFKDVFKKKEENPVFSKVEQHLKLKNTIRSRANNLLWFSNKDQALFQQNIDKGKVWTFSFPLDKTANSFARDILFVPTIYNIVLNSIEQQQLAYTVDKENFIELSNQKEISLTHPITIKSIADNSEFIPGKRIAQQNIRLDFANQIKKAGHYWVKQDNNTITGLAFNYNRNESQLYYKSMNELEEQIKRADLKDVNIIKNINTNFTTTISELNSGTPLWRWCLLLAILFIIAEILIARLWK